MATKSDQLTDGESFVPYVSEERPSIPEFTWVVLVMGVLQVVFFALADSYLALKLGMTMGASIPAAVISMSVLRGVLKRESVLENNLVQNMASVGESLATGAMFTIPALLILQQQLASGQVQDAATGVMPIALGPFQLYVIACVGGLMGILFMIPMRRTLIVKEHGRLRYPEGTACAEVLIAGDQGGRAATSVFLGVAVAGAYNGLQKLLGLFKETVAWPVSFLRTEVSFQLAPSLLAVGFILGLPTCGILVSGAFLGWFVIIPLIGYFGAGLTTPVYPAPAVISALSPIDLWDYYLRYIGAGAVAFGGLVGLVRALPTIATSIVGAVAELKASRKPQALKRTSQDLSMYWVVAGWILLFIVIAGYRTLNPAGIVGACLAVGFSFLFVTVSSRIVGIVGTSSMPLSGMTIGALLVTCLIVRSLHLQGSQGMATVLVLASMICIAIAMGGDISQDLKIGFLVGATPRWVQITQVISVFISSFVVSQVVHLLSPLVVNGKLPAPQANLMYLVTKGVFDGNLPWVPVLIGMGIAASVEMMGVDSLPFAVGLYLPLGLSTTLVFGGLLHYVFHRVTPKVLHKAMVERGLLLASGLVAGDALVGLVAAGLAAKDLDRILPDKVAHWAWTGANLTACLAFFLLIVFMVISLGRYVQKLQQEKMSIS